MPQFPGAPQRPQYHSVEAYLLDLAKDIAMLVVDSEKIKRFREQLPLYNEMWMKWIIAEDANREGCWIPSMGKPEEPLNVFSPYYDPYWRDAEKQAKKLATSYALLAFIHDSQLPHLEKINTIIKSEEIIKQTLLAPEAMIEGGTTPWGEIYLIEEFFNLVNIDLKENCVGGGSKLEPEDSLQKEQRQQISMLSDVELFEQIAEKFKKRTTRVLEKDETWLNLDRSLKGWFNLGIQRLQQAGKDNEVGLLKYNYNNLLHFARNINIKSFRGFARNTDTSSAREYVVELAEKFEDIAKNAKEVLAQKKAAKKAQSQETEATSEIELIEQIAHQLKDLNSIESCPKTSTDFSQWKLKLEGIINVESFWGILDWLRYSAPPLDDGEIKSQAEELWQMVNAITVEEADNYQILGPVDEVRNRTHDLAETLLRRVEIAKRRLKTKEPVETRQYPKEHKEFLDEVASSVHKLIQDQNNRKEFQSQINDFRSLRDKFSGTLKKAQEAAIADPKLRYDYDDVRDKDKAPPKPPIEGYEVESYHVLDTQPKGFWRPPLPFNPDGWLSRFQCRLLGLFLPEEEEPGNRAQMLMCEYALLAAIHDEALGIPACDRLTDREQDDWVSAILMKWRGPPKPYLKP
ncbi:MAG TPA: hypothetical protein VMW72_00990 [Sedimentisphaerales bacterium]|nr:hypothetical protein [Sedimentisphaerales bacterium]